MRWAERHGIPVADPKSWGVPLNRTSDNWYYTMAMLAGPVAVTSARIGSAATE